MTSVMHSAVEQDTASSMMANNLRDYQIACLEAILDRYKAGIKRQLIVLPTGTGKTYIATNLPPLLGWPRTLFIVHREELIQQAVTAFRSTWPGMQVGIERGSERALTEHIVVASVQSLARSERLRRFPPGSFPLVIIDEAHHSPANIYRRILNGLGILDGTFEGLLLGMTATSRRGDGVALGSVFREVTFSRTILEMVDAGWLSPLRGYLIRSGVSLEKVRVHHGDFDEKQLAYAVDIEMRNTLVVRSYLELARGRPTIVFAVNVAHAEHLAGMFRKAGVRAEAIHGSLRPDERARRIRAFHLGELELLTNCQVLTEGFDEPRVSCIIMARPTCSSLLYIQCVGRGTRIAPGKDDCLVIDIADNTRRHAGQLVTLPTLFGLPPEFNLEGREARTVMREYEKAASMFSSVGVPEELINSLLTPRDIRRLLEEVDLLRFARVPPHIAAASPFTWQHMPGGRYMARVDSEHVVEVSENVLGRFDVFVTSPTGKIKLAECVSLVEGIRWASHLIFDRWPDAVPRLRRSARWRDDPATGRQLEVLKKMGITPWEGITKGQASMLIERQILSRR